jgi:hypothetical protein
MSKHEPTQKDGNGIDDKTMTVPVAGGTLIYRVERERRRAGIQPVAQELVDVEVDDARRLADVLAELGHDRGHAYHGGVR